MIKEQAKTKNPYMVKDYSQKLVELRKKAPGILGLPFGEILKRCGIPEEVFQVYEQGHIPPWLPHVHALYEEFNLSLNWLLFDIEPMFEKRDNLEQKMPGGVFEYTSDNIPIYTFFSNFMRDPDIEEFFLVLLNIILKGSLDGLKKALQEDPATAAFFQDSAPGTQADADQQ